MSTGRLSKEELQTRLKLESEFCQFINDNYPSMVKVFLNTVPEYFERGINGYECGYGYTVNCERLIFWCVKHNTGNITSEGCMRWIMSNPEQFEMEIL